MKNDIHILKICKQIEQSVGRKISNFSDINWLVNEFHKRGIYIGSNTLARVFSLIARPNKTYISTLDSLALFLEYTNWDNYVSHQQKNNVTHNFFLTENAEGFSENILEIALLTKNYKKVAECLKKYENIELSTLHYSASNLLGAYVIKSNYDEQLLRVLAKSASGRQLFYETFVDENNENNYFSNALTNYYLPEVSCAELKFYVCCFNLAQNLYQNIPSNAFISEFYFLADKVNFKEAHLHVVSRWFEIRFLLLFSANQKPTTEFQNLVKEWLFFIVESKKNEWIIARSLKAILSIGLKQALIENNEFNALIHQVLFKKRNPNLSAALFIIQLYWLHSNKMFKSNYEPIYLQSFYVQGNRKEFFIIETAITYLYAGTHEKKYLQKYLQNITAMKQSWILKLLFD